MLPPIVCNCGLPIGDIARKFDEMRNEITKNETKDIPPKTDPNNVIYMTNKPNINLDKVFEALGNLPLCCRTQLNTNMLFSNYY